MYIPHADYRCTDCKCTNVVYDHGDIVCTGCGLVLEERVLDYESEWRNFASDADNGITDRSRVGAPDELNDKARLMAKLSSRLDEYKMLLRGTTSFMERPVDVALEYIATYIDKTIVRGDDKRRAVAASAYYLSSRTTLQAGLTKDEICSIMTVDLHLFCKTCSEMEKLLALDESMAPVRNLQVEDNQSRVLDDVARAEGWDKKMRMAVWRIMNKFIRLIQSCDDFASTVASKLTAALVYVSCRSSGVKISAKRIATITGTSEASISENETILMKVYKRRAAEKAASMQTTRCSA